MGALQGQVDALRADRHLGDAQAVVEDVQGIAELAGRNIVVRQAQAVRDQSDLRRAQLQAGVGAKLVALFLGHQPQDAPGGLDRDGEVGLQVRAHDVDLDLAPAAEAAAEERELVDEREGAGLTMHRLGEHRLQLRRARGVHCGSTQEGGGAEGDEEETVDLRRLAGLVLGPCDAGPERARAVLDALGDLGHGLQVVARRWDDDAEHQVAVALGQIFQLRQVVPGRGPGRASDQHDHG